MLKKSADLEKAREYLKGKEGKQLPDPAVRIKLEKLLREFVLRGDVEL